MATVAARERVLSFLIEKFLPRTLNYRCRLDLQARTLQRVYAALAPHKLFSNLARVPLSPLSTLYSDRRMKKSELANFSSFTTHSKPCSSRAFVRPRGQKIHSKAGPSSGDPSSYSRRRPQAAAWIVYADRYQKSVSRDISMRSGLFSRSSTWPLSGRSAISLQRPDC